VRRESGCGDRYRHGHFQDGTAHCLGREPLNGTGQAHLPATAPVVGENHSINCSLCGGASVFKEQYLVRLTQTVQRLNRLHVRPRSSNPSVFGQSGERSRLPVNVNDPGSPRRLQPTARVISTRAAVAIDGV